MILGKLSLLLSPGLIHDYDLPDVLQLCYDIPLIPTVMGTQQVIWAPIRLYVLRTPSSLGHWTHRKVLDRLIALVLFVG